MTFTPDRTSTPSAPSEDFSDNLLAASLKILDDKKAENIFHSSKHRVPYCDYVVVATAMNARHAKSLADDVKVAMKEAGAQIVAAEGIDAGRWVLIDGLWVIVHIILAPLREYYELEEQWKDDID